MKTKKIITICLPIVLLFIMLGGFKLTANAYQIKFEGAFNYYVKNDKIVIVDCNSLAETIKVPSKIENKEVTRINQHTFEDCKNLKQLVIPKTVTFIENGTFDDCKKLETITYGGKYEQWSDIQLNFFDRIGTKATVYGKDFIEGEYNCKILKDGTLEIKSYRDSETVKKLEIPSKLYGKKVTRIGYEAFSECRKLKTIKLPNTIVEIGECAFRYCESLKTIEIPSKVTYIKDYTFQYSGLKSITLPKGLKKLGRSLFSSSLKSVNYKGKMSQWKNLNIKHRIEISEMGEEFIDSDNSALIKATIYCSNGKISREKPVVKSLKSGKKSIKASWSKVSGVTGYEVQIATNNKFNKNKKTFKVSKQTTSSTNIKNLKSKQKYYVRVRTYRTQKVQNAKKVLYSGWSKIGKVTVK